MILHRVMLDLRTILSYGGEHQSTTLIQILDDFKIASKISTITGDNATTNDTLCRTFTQHLFNTFKIRWNLTTQRLRYLSHIINLAVQDFLFKNQIKSDELKLYERAERTGADFENSIQ